MSLLPHSCNCPKCPGRGVPVLGPGYASAMKKWANEALQEAMKKQERDNHAMQRAVSVALTYNWERLGLTWEGAARDLWNFVLQAAGKPQLTYDAPLLPEAPTRSTPEAPESGRAVPRRCGEEGCPCGTSEPEAKPDAKFKPGDRVRCVSRGLVGSYASHFLAPVYGGTYVVMKYDKGYVQLKEPLDGDEWHESNFEPMPTCSHRGERCSHG